MCLIDIYYAFVENKYYINSIILLLSFFLEIFTTDNTLIFFSR